MTVVRNSNETWNSLVSELLHGSFDLHVHAGPDPYQERRLDALETARYAHEAEMAGFVLKSHHYPTGALARTLCRVYPGLTVIGAIVLNWEVGGCNPDAVEAAARIGTKVIWMPTRSAPSDSGKRKGIQLTNDKGVLVPEVYDIIDIAKQHDMAIASGHSSPQDAITLFNEAEKKGVHRLIATHPSGVSTDEEMRRMSSHGAYIEFTFASCMPSGGAKSPKAFAASIKAIGPERCVVTSDFGQWMNPSPAEGMRMAIAAFLDTGIEPYEVEKLVKSNPRELVGLDRG